MVSIRTTFWSWLGASLASSFLGIWTGDERWGATAALFVVPTAITGLVAAVKALGIDERYRREHW